MHACVSTHLFINPSIPPTLIQSAFTVPLVSSRGRCKVHSETIERWRSGVRALTIMSVLMCGLTSVLALTSLHLHYNIRHQYSVGAATSTSSRILSAQSVRGKQSNRGVPCLSVSFFSHKNWCTLPAVSSHERLRLYGYGIAFAVICQLDPVTFGWASGH